MRAVMIGTQHVDLARMSSQRSPGQPSSFLPMTAFGKAPLSGRQSSQPPALK